MTTKVKVTETSGATFTSYAPYETTTAALIEAGHSITEEDLAKLGRGEIIVLTSYNLAGTATKRVLRAIK